MAIPVLVMGESGSGKTYSLKNFSPDEVAVISVEKGRLPFRSGIKVTRLPRYDRSPDFTTYAQINAAKYSWLEAVIEKAKSRAIVIDDSQYLMANELFDRSSETGYTKFLDIAKNFRNLIHFINELPQDDKIVYFLQHVEQDAKGRTKCKTVGRMLDEKLCVEGCFDIVLYCEDHEFWTQGNGTSTAKTPEGLFESLKIPNDLKAVDTAIRKYWNLGGEH